LEKSIKHFELNRNKFCKKKALELYTLRFPNNVTGFEIDNEIDKKNCIFGLQIHLLFNSDTLGPHHSSLRKQL